MLKYLPDHLMLADKADNLHLTRTFRAGQRVDFPYLLDAGPPQQLRDAFGPVTPDFNYFIVCTLLSTIFLVRFLLLLSVTAHSITILAIVANQLKRMLRDMLSDRRDTFQR